MHNHSIFTKIFQRPIPKTAKMNFSTELFPVTLLVYRAFFFVVVVVLDVVVDDVAVVDVVVDIVVVEIVFCSELMMVYTGT